MANFRVYLKGNAEHPMDIAAFPIAPHEALLLHLPECRRIGRQLASTAKIMGLSREEVLRHAASRIKVSRVGIP